MYLKLTILRPHVLSFLIVLLLLVSKCATNEDSSSSSDDYDDESDGPSSSPSLDDDSTRSSITSSTESTEPPSTLPFTKEGESLSKLQKFMLEGVEAMIKQTLPTLIRSGLETNVSTACANSLLALVSGLRDSQIWAFRSKLLSPLVS